MSTAGIAAGCGASQDSGWEGDPSEGVPEARADPGVELVLENGTGEPVYVQTSNPGGYREWVRLRGPDGEPLDIEGNCAICVCGEPCWVCGIALPTVDTVSAGGDVRVSWDRTVWTLRGDDAGEACRRREPGPDGPLAAEFCWGTGVVDGPVGQHIAGEPTCRSLTFDPDTDREVRYRIGS